jgi:hypothetical protein
LEELARLAGTHLALEHVFSLRLAPLGNYLILGLDISDDAVQVQAAVVVHGQDDIGFTDVSLHLRQLLQDIIIQ